MSLSARAPARASTTRRAVGRRTVLAGGGLAVLGAAGLAGASGAAATTAGGTAAAPAPRLPGEVARSATRTTRVGRTPYESVDVVLGGDRARLYLPWGAPLKGDLPGSAVWFYPPFGSDHTSLDGAYAYGAMLAVDEGSICLCPTFGASLTSEAAVEHQAAWARWAEEVLSVSCSFVRATSGGGALMTYAYARGMVRGTRGAYLANAVYDVEDLWARDPDRIGPLYGDDPAAVAAGNPARLPSHVWTGKRLKVVTSPQDPVVPERAHGLALAARAEPVASEVLRLTHAQGHLVPGSVHADMISTFRSWL